MASEGDRGLECPIEGCRFEASRPDHMERHAEVLHRFCKTCQVAWARRGGLDHRGSGHEVIAIPGRQDIGNRITRETTPRFDGASTDSTREAAKVKDELERDGRTHGGADVVVVGSRRRNRMEACKDWVSDDCNTGNEESKPTSEAEDAPHANGNPSMATRSCARRGGRAGGVMSMSNGSLGRDTTRQGRVTVAEAGNNHFGRGQDQHTQVLWMMRPDGNFAAEATQDCVSVTILPGEPRCNPWLESDEQVAELKAKWKGFVRTIKTAHGRSVSLHQSLVLGLMMVASPRDGVTVKMARWHERDRTEVWPHIDRHDRQTRFVVAVVATGQSTQSQLRKMYDDIDHLRDSAKLDIRPYPSRQEMEASNGKVADILAFDSVAKCQDNWAYGYRPVTCYGGGRCMLQGEAPTMGKRNWSAASEHVEVFKQGWDNKLTCDQSEAAPKRRKLMVDKHRWIHQQYEKNLKDYEFRVYIVTVADDNCLRRRKGKLFRIVLTGVKEGKLEPTDATEHDTEQWASFPQWKDLRNDVERFSLWAFEQLRLFHHIIFETLEVGCRMDLGLAEDGRLFINELTRWFECDYFSDMSSYPHTTVCNTFRTAFQDWLETM